MKNDFKSIEALKNTTETLVEVELMLRQEELLAYGEYCRHKGVKFNDWIRKLAYDALEEEKR